MFDQALRSVSGSGSAGDLGVVFDDNRRFVAIGLYDPDSPIRLRILHQGKPRQIDSEFFTDKIQRAFQARADLEEDPDTTAFRIVNGENDGLGGLIVDRYENAAVVKIYTKAWFPHLRSVIDAVVGLSSIDSVLLRLGREVSDGETFGLNNGDLLAGPEVSDVVQFKENALTFGADLRRGHKTGHFLDQRDNRQRVRDLSDAKVVLDVFACTGGFSVHAAAGGASLVTSVDVSAPALSAARLNMTLNGLETNHEIIVGDAYQTLSELAAAGRSFDLVVVDPPSFAHSKDQIDRAKAAYLRLATAAAKVVGANGLLFHSSCSNRVDEDEFGTLVDQGIQRAGRSSRCLARYGHGTDHPVTFPQGAYLKAVLRRLT